MDHLITQEIIGAAIEVHRRPGPGLLESTYRIDFLVKGQVVVEIKAIEGISQIHVAQLLTYLRLLNLRKGRILNFNVSALKDGIKRVSNEKRIIPTSDCKTSETSAFSESLR